MSQLLELPILIDIGAAVAQYMFAFTPQDWDPVKIGEETPHKEYFETNIKDTWVPGIESQWNFWLIWDSV